MSRTQLNITLAVLAVLFGFVGHMDHDDLQAEQAHYCAMVKAKAWPDYHGTYQRECLPPKTAQR